MVESRRKNAGLPTQRSSAADAPAPTPSETVRSAPAPLVPTQFDPTTTAARPAPVERPLRVVPAAKPPTTVPPTPPTAPPTTPSTIGTRPLTGGLDHIPTQRTEPEPEAVPSTRRRTAVLLVAAVAVTALVATTVVVQAQRTQRAEDLAAAQQRVSAAAAAFDAETSAVHDEAAIVALASWTARQEAGRAGAQAAAASVVSTLAATPHAGDAPRTALQTSLDAVSGTLADPTTSLVALRTVSAGVAAPVKAATDAEAAWQAAEAARIAAEQAAAAQAAAAAAAAAPRSTPARSTRSSGSVAAPAAGGIPSGGLVCPGAPTGGGAGESSVSAIGAGINAFREGLGLPALSVARSGTLVAHAEAMAAAGGIWHSGGDNIVGCTSGSVSSLINAWANSAGHRAQMVRTDVTSMSVGGASLGGWLYGAVKFNR